ncbi:tripartite tricarboxylate transporter substrate binding protein [Roseiarcaceae bacterium H3SJ34-1]|uniref:Bug family tripartite tricarboxylate transporter substrate binding protein n=1 Tax=Terripilifer ovatus TaxID=3032367 RepID=UPI003AB971EA|nr:tripartite tricarboxylate transporter substrate binding protein [Roseiarcaceae bacterium H3SJ34-1]
MKNIWALAVAFAASVAATAAITTALAQPAPGAQLNLIVGFAAGGSADSIARVVGNRLGEKHNRKIVVENRPGAGANIATRAVIGATPDGSTLLVSTAALAINETLYRNKGFSVDALRTIAVVATTPEVFAVNPANPGQTLADFVQQNRGKEITFATAGIGTSSHIAAEYFFSQLVKTEARHVPFRGGPDATNAVLGGHVPMVVSSLSGFASQVAGGQLTGLAVAADQRVAVIGKVPTFTEAGYPGFKAMSWVGFFAPSATPSAELVRLNKEIDDIVREPAIRERLIAIGFDPMNATQPEAETYFRREVEQWRKMVQTLGLSVE